ncbi:MAG: efflux RND transporter permease subunit [Nostocaceae cyanobacterium]|nr:efflux RND transporter permease subunit [Nostocaceae cyanobacterium]
MSKLLYKNFRLLILTIFLIIVWGVTSYLSLPRLEDPELVSRVGLVTTFYPGATAERVEALVTEKIENKIAEIEEIKTYESTSRNGTSIISIELLDRMKSTEVDGVWSRVRDRLREVKPELPPEATEPDLEKVQVRAYALIAALSWEQDDSLNLAILQRKAKLLQDELRTIGGTEKVEIFGAPDEEVRVTVNTADLAALGLTATDVSRQIQQSDSKSSAGQLRSNNNDLLIEVKGELDSLKRLRQIPIRCNTCGSTDSQFKRLGDLARIEKGIVEPPNELAFASGHPAVTVAVFVESQQRIDIWAKQAHQKLEKFRQDLPSSMKLKVLLEQNQYVTARLNNLIFSLLLGAVLLFAVTLLMMGWELSLAMQIVLPLTVLIVVGCMNFLGVPLHQMSVTGLIVALGIMIDNAIIVTDEVHNRLKAGLKPVAAIQASVKYLIPPLTAASFTTILSFLPIVLLPGNTGEFVGTIGLNVILAVAASLVVALTITPVITVKILKYYHRRRQLKQSRSIPKWWQEGFSSPKLTQIYSLSLKWTFAKPVMGILLCLSIPLSGFILGATQLELQFFPTADRNQLQVQLELPSSASLEQTQSIVQQIRERFIAHPEITDVHWYVGRSAPNFYYNLINNRQNQANYANALVQMKGIASDDLVKQLQSEVDVEFPQAQVLVRPLEQGPPVDAPIEMRIYGNDIQRLQELGEKARTLLVNVNHVTHTRASLNEVLPQLEFRVDEEQARLAGLDNTKIAQQLNTTLEGITGGSILESTEELPVRVRLSNADRGNLQRITTLDLQTATSNSQSLNSTPLSALGEVKLAPKLAAITRYNGLRVNTVQGFITAGNLPATILTEFQKQLNSNLQLPPGYSFEFGGEDENRSDAVGNLFSSIALIAVSMFAILVLSLGSFRLASLIVVIAILSAGLGLFSVWLFGYPYGFNPIIGTVGLIGVAVNDSITVLSALNSNPAARTGNKKAVREIVIHSTRHVLTTTLTTMFGFLPLILAGGGFWPPLAVVIAGGVGGATMLSLYFIPSVYILITRKGTNISHLSV